MSRALGGSSSSTSWMSNLPLVLLGLRTTIREDAQCCPADAVYGCQLRLPGDLLDPSPAPPSSSLAPFVDSLRSSMLALHPLLPVRRSARDRAHLPSALSKASHVFLRVDAVRRPLTPPYDGPFLVLGRAQKTFDILKGNKKVTVSVDRLKPAFIDFLPQDSVLQPPTIPVPSLVAGSRPPSLPGSSSPSVTPPERFSRSGRRLRPPDRL